MATYFHGAPEMTPDGGLQTLYLMNPSYVGGYADVVASPASMVLLNSTINNNSVNSINLQQQHFVGIPLHQPSAPASQHESNRGGQIHEDVSSAVQGLLPRLQHSFWGAAPTTSTRDPAVGAARKGLSLSLSPHEMAPTEMPPERADEAKINGASGLLTGFKYLKAAQQLLDEVVNVGKEIKDESPKKATSKNPAAAAAAAYSNFKSTDAGGEDNDVAKRATDLTSAEKQELQMKKAKLVNMLEEVEQRYRQYRHQMHAVVSSFESVAGNGSARTYTSLALRTISKQFRCLRDTIACQIQATSRSLGEEEAKSVGSRLRFIDHHLKQQRALQQLGMIQHNAWRPQRGLPERSVSILRAWLFEHFLHPYPKDSDKLMLAKQTGLTRSQVSNWFINARVRLWKPMVEEMYMDEVKDQEQNTSEDMAASKSDARGSSASKSNALVQKQENNAPVQPSYYEQDDEMALPSAAAIKKARRSEEEEFVAGPTTTTTTSNQELLMKLMDGRPRVGDQQQGFNSPSLIPGHGSYGGYSIEQLAPRFSGNGVSLTLGLQHNGSHSLSVVHPSSFLTSQGSDYSTAVAHPSHAAAFMADRGLLLNYYHTS